MLKNKALALILLSIVFMSTEAFSQPIINPHKDKVTFGKVVRVDEESGVLDVKIDEMVLRFYLTAETELTMSTHMISVLEIDKGDPVKIRYACPSGKNIVLSLDDQKG